MAEHIVPPKTYVTVFLALLALTALTVGVSRLPISEDWHTIIGLTIATAKASLVLLFFMHVLYSGKLTWLIALSGLLWLAILITYTVTDYMTRTWSPSVGQ